MSFDMFPALSPNPLKALRAKLENRHQKRNRPLPEIQYLAEHFEKTLEEQQKRQDPKWTYGSEDQTIRWPTCRYCKGHWEKKSVPSYKKKTKIQEKPSIQINEILQERKSI